MPKNNQLLVVTNKKIQEITACAFIHKDGKLFVARRAPTKSFLPGVHELPGGHIEFGESMEDGLKREIKEEFGIDIMVGDPFHVFTYVWKNKTKHVVEVIYFATMSEPNQEIQLDPNDHSEFNWIIKSEVLNFFINNDQEGIVANRGFDIMNKKNTP